MSLRPRYSLLAFLLFTAAVAVGIKLWRGPHHVVDRSNPQLEDEYSYYKQFNNTKIVDGIRILRYYDADDELRLVRMFYYRQGTRVGQFPIIVRKGDSFQDLQLSDFYVAGLYPGLSENESLEFKAKLLEEQKRFHDAGIGTDILHAE